MRVIPCLPVLAADSAFQLAVRQVEQCAQALPLDVEVLADHLVSGAGCLQAKRQGMRFGQAPQSRLVLVARCHNQSRREAAIPVS
jgi:hypothetical protein